MSGIEKLRVEAFKRKAQSDIQNTLANQAKTERELEDNKNLKVIADLTDAISKSIVSDEKLSSRMYWLTIATVALAVIQVIIAVITFLISK